MMMIECPWCGQRDQSEFTAHGEAHIARPTSTENLSQQQWGDYLFFRSNPKGLHYERWVHSNGCRQWFNVARNTATDEVYASYKPAEKKPEVYASYKPAEKKPEVTVTTTGEKPA